MKKGCLRATFFFAINKQGFYDKEALGKLHKENFTQRQEHSFRLFIRKTIMRVFNFVFYVECGSLSDINASKKKDCPKTVFPKCEENLRITTGVVKRGLPRE
jgi:hypothetical protein